MRNPLIAGLRQSNGSAHCLKATEKGKNRTSFSGLVRLALFNLERYHLMGCST